MRLVFSISFFLLSFASFAQKNIATIDAGENITAPAWVKLTAGDIFAADLATGQAIGVILVSATTGNPDQVFMPGSIIEWPGGGLTVGATYYLSSSTAGAMTSTKPSPLSQVLGYAFTATDFYINPQSKTTEQHFPVGGIFVSTVSTNPNTLLGYGTWEAFGAGRTIVGIDGGQTEFDTNGETGGAKTHTLTVDEIPSHRHTYTQPNTPSANVGVGLTNSVPGVTEGINSGATGGGAAHNNLQPYIVVYLWKRTN